MKNNRNIPKYPGAMTPAEKTHRIIYNTLETILGGIMLSAPVILLLAMYAILN